MGVVFLFMQMFEDKLELCSGNRVIMIAGDVSGGKGSSDGAPHTTQESACCHYPIKWVFRTMV